jgi:hypothetical protein
MHLTLTPAHASGTLIFRLLGVVAGFSRGDDSVPSGEGLRDKERVGHTNELAVPSGLKAGVHRPFAPLVGTPSPTLMTKVPSGWVVARLFVLCLVSGVSFASQKSVLKSCKK